MLSAGQGAFFLAFAWTLVIWLWSEYLNWVARQKQNAKLGDDLGQYNSTDSDDQDTKKLTHETGVRATNGQTEDCALVSVVVASNDKPPGPDQRSPPRRQAKADDLNSQADAQRNSSMGVTGAATANWKSVAEDMLGSGFVRCIVLDTTAIQAALPTLRAMAEFGTLMAWYFVCDRTEVIPDGAKTYSRDLFYFLFLILTLVAFANSLTPLKPPPTLLVRQQTEEWKGWMQVLFLLYHYFEAKEAYNAIRIFIAGYVWMTGFGNFLYYYKTQDFSIGRFAQMMWRLNFLVFFVCVALKNSYMLYYICPMHTIFTVMVYICLGIAYHLNKSKMWLAVKMVCCWLSVIVLWNKTVFYTMWSPLIWLVGYKNPRKPDDQDLMHEWYFRSSLDRYIWIYGMMCAVLHPYCQQLLNQIDTLAKPKQWAIRAGLLAACAVAGWIYTVKVFMLPALEYNVVHPYTSWIPITIWIVLRNITPTLRLHHLKLYGWLGCITLETYICQFHIWMKTGMPDGQPKQLLVLLPGYPLLNFALVTAGYIFISHRLFELTNTLKNVAVPHSNNYMLLRNTLLMGAAGAAIYAVAYGGLNLLAPALTTAPEPALVPVT